MRKMFVGVLACLLAACPGVRKAPPTRAATAAPATAPTQAPEEEIGLISVRTAPLSEQVACVFGGWTCLSGEQASLLRCTTDGGKTFS